MLLKKLIIAEDDDDTSYLLLTALGDSGFLCMRARNGEEALNLTRTELPDALRLLSRHDVGALVVVRGDAVAGVFSERYIQGA